MMDRIEIDPKIMAGKPVIKGTRIPVYLILDLLAAGEKVEDITREYPNLNEKDVIAAIEYASNLLKGERIVEVEA
jgi:uncharacterized protein (DUF433 family)